ncbi:MAG: hypothetical protein WCJ30_24665 [Deltaproteobacteria bacterium]
MAEDGSGQSEPVHAEAAPAPKNRRGWFSLVVVFAPIPLVLIASATMLVVSHGSIAPPDIDSPPGVVGALRVEVAPVMAQVFVDHDEPRLVEHRLTIPGLDPNFPHQIRVAAPGYDDFEQWLSVPAHGVRTLSVTLRPAQSTR